MFYHAALLLDYNRFTREASELARAVEQGNLAPLYHQASEIVRHTLPDTFLLRSYGYGGLLKPPRPIAEVDSSPYRNFEIGQWFMLVMSTCMEPCPISIGYNWGNLVSALEKLKWETTDIEKLFYGLPTGLLVTPAASGQHFSQVTHSDPYWRWIRPLYTYNQGGWLPVEECERLLTALRQTEPHIMMLDYKGPPELTGEQMENWKRSIEQGCKDALAMLSVAVKENTGLYMVILWEWDDVDER